MHLELSVTSWADPREPSVFASEANVQPLQPDPRAIRDRNDPLTITAEVAISDRLGLSVGRAAAETGCTVSWCGFTGAVATSPHLEHQGGLFS